MVCKTMYSSSILLGTSIFLFCLYETHSFLFAILLHGFFHFLTDFEFMQ